jgi:hypothetical protein
MLFGDVMAAAWVKDASWDGFPSSHLGQFNSPKRNTLETAFSFFNLPLKFSDQRRMSKTRVPEEIGDEPPPGPLNVRFVINHKPLTIHHKLITFHIHDGYRSIGERRVNNVRSIPLALQFTISKVLNLEL